ncbi:MAG: DUF983 domain-containing protein [Leadbetterella sp.]
MGKLKHTISFKCPSCGMGALFVPRTFFTMYENCPDCKLKYEKEVGFFYGAMYVSYAINVLLFIVSLVLYYSFEEVWNWKWYIGFYLLITLISTPIIFRLSRSIWLSINIPFKVEKN